MLKLTKFGDRAPLGITKMRLVRLLANLVLWGNIKHIWVRLNARSVVRANTNTGKADASASNVKWGGISAKQDGPRASLASGIHGALRQGAKSLLLARLSSL